MRQWMTLLFSVFITVQMLGQGCDSIPVLNQQIITLAKAKTGKKVDRGECWDLANYVLTETQAVWNGIYEFGEVVDPQISCVFPGDILQFEKVRLKYSDEGVTIVETMDHHTAIVSAVKSKDELVLIHQNTGDHGKRVGESTFRFKSIVKGKVIVYRPVSSIIE